MGARIQVAEAAVAELMADPDIDRLLAEYEVEGRSPEMPPMQPQWRQYEALERAGVLEIFAAREGGVLIGVVSVLRSQLPHYGGAIAVVESLFARPEHRLTGAGLALIRAAEASAARQGLALLITARVGSALEALLRRRRGYRPSNTVFVRSFA